MAQMTTEQRDAFLQEARIASLVTLRDDGAPTVQPVWFEWDGTEARLFTNRTSAKVGRIEDDPRVALSVEEPVGVPEAWVTIEGTARIDEAGGYELAERLAARYYTRERAAAVLPAWERMRDQWVVVHITPVRVVSSSP